MFTPKLVHKHTLVESRKRTRIVRNGIPIPYIIKMRICTGEHCQFYETYDMIPEDSDTPRMQSIHTEPKKVYAKRR